jgi:hypothetical protein
MTGHISLQQHTRFDVILGSPIFTNKDLVFVNNADPLIRAELFYEGLMMMMMMMMM